MIFESKYDIDEIVFIKDSRGGVKRGKISSIGIDNAKKNEFKFVYLIWVSDRKDWGGHHERAYEHNIGKTFDEAYFEAQSMMPWNIMDDVKRKDFQQFFAKERS